MNDQPSTIPAGDEVAAPATEPAAITEPVPRGPLSALRRGAFARYAAGDAISNVGYWMQAAAQSLVVADLTTKAVDLGWVNFCGSVPMLALTMYGGTVADRFDKRKIIILSQVVQIILATAIGWLVATGRVELWHILTASVLLGVSASFEMPATSALVPEMVEREEIAAAVAIDRSIFHGSRLVGFALAGYVVGIFGKAVAFYVNAASFLTSIAAIASVSPRPQGSVEEEQQRTSGMKAGIDYVRRDKPTLAMLGLMASGSLFVFPFMAVMLPQFARHTLGLDDRYTSFLWSFSGIGALVASFVVPMVARPRRILWLTVAVVDVAVSLCALGLAHNFWQGAIALSTLGVGTAFNFGVANTTVQERAPGPLRGRVSALAMLSFIGIMPFTSLGVTAVRGLDRFSHGRWSSELIAYGIARAVPARWQTAAGKLHGVCPSIQSAVVPAEG